MRNDRPERRVLLDQNAPRRLIGALPTFDIVTARHRGWSELSNGALIAAAEQASFDILPTADRNLRHQQNLADRSIGVVVMPTNRWTLVQRNLPAVASALLSVTPGTMTITTFANC